MAYIVLNPRGAVPIEGEGCISNIAAILSQGWGAHTYVHIASSKGWHILLLLVKAMAKGGDLFVSTEHI